MTEDNQELEISKQLRLPRTRVLPNGPRPGGLRADAAAAARAAANPSEATELMTPAAGPAPAAVPVDASGAAAVTAMGLYEFLRALAMCSLFAVTLARAHTQLNDAEWDIYYLMSNGSITPTFFTVAYTIVAVVVGAGLWTRQPWARWAIVVFSFVAVVQYTAWAFLFSIVTAAMRQPDPTQVDLARSLTYSMIFVNLAIGLYMAFSKAAAGVFGQASAGDPKLHLPPVRPTGV
jgi:hypothetical protein